MGKQRRQRQKLHLAATGSPSKKICDSSSLMDTTPLPLSIPMGNIFEGLNIDINSISKKLSDDMQSLKSYKSVKSELGKAISKKDKLKLRREMFLKKIDVINQQKRENQLRKKRKSTAIMGDTNPLHDALPSLESLLKSRSNIPYKQPHQPAKPKGIEKATKRKKDLLQGVQIYKNLLKNKKFQNNPLDTINEHIKAVVSQEKANLKQQK